MTTDEAEYREKIRDDDKVADRCARERMEEYRAEDARAEAEAEKLETRYCKDCKWCSGSVGLERCGSPLNTESIVDMVSGKAQPKFSFCSSQRDAILDSDKTCGREGRWFELKTD